MFYNSVLFHFEPLPAVAALAVPAGTTRRHVQAKLLLTLNTPHTSHKIFPSAADAALAALDAAVCPPR